MRDVLIFSESNERNDIPNCLSDVMHFSLSCDARWIFFFFSVFFFIYFLCACFPAPLL
jgi:hypothetical protein